MAAITGSLVCAGADTVWSLTIYADVVGACADTCGCGGLLRHDVRSCGLIEWRILFDNASAAISYLAQNPCVSVSTSRRDAVCAS